MIQLEIDGVPFEGFTQVTVTKSLGAASGAFSATATAIPGDPFPILINDPVRVLVDGEPVISGYIEEVSPSHSETSHLIRISGRDGTADFIDSSVGDISEIVPPISLAQVARATLEGMGIKGVGVEDFANPEPFTKNDLVSAEVGETGIQFLEKYARKRGVLLTSNGEGDLVITRAGLERFPVALISRVAGNPSENNVLSGSASFNHAARFHSYQVVSQLNPAAEDMGADPFAVAGQAAEVVDGSIRTGRTTTIVAEEASDDAACSQRASWEANIKRANGTRATMVVAGFKAGGQLWRPNVLVQVENEWLALGAEMLIKSVEYSFSDRGSLTTIEVVPPDAFTLNATREQRKAERESLGDTFTS